MSDRATSLHAGASAAAEDLPALYLEAERLARAVQHGAHGLRRAGAGEDFWQYRPAHDSDSARMIDWRRSGRSDARFVRDRERQGAEALVLWVSCGAGMDYAGAEGGQGTRKLDRARLIGLGAALLALRAGERAGWLGETPSAGRQAGFKLAARMLAGSSEPGAQWRAGDAGELSGDHDSPDAALIRPSGKHLLIGDFLGDLSGLEAALHRAASLGARGVLVQVLHPDEEDFPFQGAMRFRAPSGGGQHLTRDAAGLAAAYRARLEARRAALRDLAAGAGFGFAAHSLRHSAGEGLIGLWGALSA